MPINNVNQLIEIKDLFKQNSVLNFTYELHNNNQLPFLDVAITSTANGFKTSIHYKPTDHGMCLNANSHCPEKYKRSVIHNYINRAYKYSQTWDTFHNEISKIKQTLVNNSYSNTLIDQEINRYLDKKFSTPNNSNTNTNIIPLYYHNQMHSNYKIDEKVLNDIIHNHTKCIDPNHKLNLTIYYKNRKSHNLVMRNNLTPPKPTLQQTNLIYGFICPLSHPKVTAYIGYTQTMLSRRLDRHVYQGSIKEHFHHDHNIKVTKQILYDNTKIITKAPDKFRLTIKEALLISHHAPIVNKQFENFSLTLKLFKSNTQIEPTLPPFLQTSLSNQQPPLNIPPTPSASQTQSPDTSDPHLASQPNQLTPTHFVSPNINSRINQLLQYSRHSTINSSQPPHYSPPLLRSHTQ